MSRPTVFLAVRGGFTPRFLLRTDVLPTLLQQGVDVVILSPNADEGYFRAEFEREHVAVEPLRADELDRYGRTRPLQRLLRVLRLQVLSGEGDLTTIDQMQAVNEDTARRQGVRGRVGNLVIGAVTRCARRWRWLRALIVRVESVLFVPLVHRDLYAKYRPQALVVTSLGFSGSEPDNYLMREARRCGAKVVSLVLSWDNTSSKGLRGGPVDHVVAWTDVMKRELRDYHDLPGERVTVCGPPHFDVYYREPRLTREQLFTRMGLDPSRRLLMFGTKSPTNYPWNEEIAGMVARAIDDGRLVEPCQLLIRLHPIYYRQRGSTYKFAEFLQRARELAARHRWVTLDEPAIVSQQLALDMAATEMDKLVALLRNSSVLINIYSTLNLEAAIVDTPCVNVSFNGKEGYGLTVRRNVALDEAQPHNQRIVQSGGVAMVRNETELIAAINAYLRDPSLHREGRRRIREQECGPYPGEAGRAIGLAVSRLVA